jgi:hypothetical protein
MRLVLLELTRHLDLSMVRVSEKQIGISEVDGYFCNRRGTWFLSMVVCFGVK